ncbi:MAG: phage scaffolding protein [Candidatus Cloacimonetes bacterium]|nr:phage scaffolding protein [Candidatus Cloacimonadota bacterium]
MKKEDLLKLGLDEEAAKKVADASTEELKAYIPKARFDEVNISKRQLELDVKERDGQLETLKNSTGDVEALKTQIATLQTDNTTKNAEYEATIKQIKVDNAVEAALTGAKARNVKAVKALLDLSKADLADDGSIKGLEEQITKLVAGEDSKFLFNTETKKTKIKGAAPGEAGNEDVDGKPDMAKMSYEEIATYLEQNPDAEI